MKKKFLSAIMIVAAAVSSIAQTRKDVDVSVNKFMSQYNNKQYQDIFNGMSERIKSMMTPEQTKMAMSQLSEQAGQLKMYLFTKEEKGVSYYKTEFEKATMTLAISLDKDNKMDAFRFLPYQGSQNEPAEKSNFIYESKTGSIYGTLELPEGNKPVPVVLIIAGSGPTDRNCNQAGVQTNAFKMLADSLKKAGIATVRYDKRGIGESAPAMKNEEDLRFDDMVNDAAGFVKMLKNDKRFSSVVVAGHSEGSLVGMMAAKKAHADGYISIAGISEKASGTIVRQLAEQSEELSLNAAYMLDSLTKGYSVSSYHPDLASLFRPSAQPYLKSWLKYDPKEEIIKLDCPVLIIQGTTDIQVPQDHAEALKAAYPRATLKFIDGMNHILKQAPADREKNIATYNNPKLPLSPGLSPAIVSFVRGTEKK
ncbi:MAG: alpha/beta fold hydrolase [Taibaiella sp.]|nr:alpha/beta fold hydrolase [Taibaiella sp.]